jgi:hypothetical protein
VTVGRRQAPLERAADLHPLWVSLLGAVWSLFMGGVGLSGALLRRASGVEQAALRRAPSGTGSRRAWLQRRPMTGVRLVLVRVLGLDFWPFDTFGVFGRALLGDGSALWLAATAGGTYHLLNGVGFGSSSRSGRVAGVARVGSGCWRR